MAARFTRLALTNWRNFKKVDVDLGTRAFIVGPNASGKSNLLDALRFLRDIASPGGGLVRAVNDRRGIKHIRSLHAGAGNVVVEVDIAIDDDPKEWTYQLALSGAVSKNKPLRIEREVVRHGAKEIRNRSESDEKDPIALSQTHLEQVSQNAEFRQLAEALASLVHVHVVPQVARTPSRAEEFARREAPGSDFIDQLARLSERPQQRALRRIEKLLRIAVPQFSQLNVERDAVGKPHLVAKYEHWRPNGGWQNEQEFSDGTLRLVGLLWAIDNGTAPLVLEEPELSLHRDIIRQLPRLFAQAAQRTGRQVIASTHSEEMLSDAGVDPSEIVSLRPSEGETKVTLGSKIPEVVSAAAARIPLGKVITGLTRPSNVEQLVFTLDSGK
jgi:predicted ATPase